MIQPQRIKPLNHKSIQNGRFVLYWMQAAQRAEYNHALEYAILRANELKKPVLVFFGITEAYPSANLRHYYFMLEGLRETQEALAERDIPLLIQRIAPETGVGRLAKDACLVVTDGGYLAPQRKWRQAVARNIDCPLIQVETDCIVPVACASGREEYSAATIRPKIHKQLDYFLKPLPRVSPKHHLSPNEYECFDIQDIDRAISRLAIDRAVGRTDFFRGGARQARQHLHDFLQYKLDHYALRKNDPTLDGLSNLSPYLHFGQISPLYVALQVRKTKSPGAETFLEELIVRRELAINFVYTNPQYLSLRCLPAWAKGTLRSHQTDRREYVYSRQQFESAQTHDPYWNTAQQEMMLTGKMHGYMRMYWGKKILEWSRSPQTAYKIAVYLNDKYELDGRDANGYAGVAWCFGKHDRPWQNRPVFGMIRYMNDKGLLRKFDADGYVERINQLAGKCNPWEEESR